MVTPLDIPVLAYKIQFKSHVCACALCKIDFIVEILFIARAIFSTYLNLPPISSTHLLSDLTLTAFCEMAGFSFKWPFSDRRENQGEKFHLIRYLGAKNTRLFFCGKK